MLKGAPPKHLACSTLAPGFGVASVCLYPAASQVESPLTGTEEFHVFPFRTAAPSLLAFGETEAGIGKAHFTPNEPGSA